ncbi:hypothetical protein ABDD95_01715 [Mucilaginibacter sp. PAMB04274]|uniref:hypothetical protein n=1 Tax=Mucilaginibacter sp. PAMB04274 TaxID=3138568 RepID=UPI0031F66EB7
MKKLVYLSLFSLLFITSCEKKEDEEIEFTVVGTWKARKFSLDVVNCGNAGNPGSSSVTREGSQLSNILLISPDGSGNITANGELLATFNWTYSDQDIDHFFIKFSNYKIVNAKSDDLLVNAISNFKFEFHEFSETALGFYSVTYPSAANSCLTEYKWFNWERISK